MESLAFQTLSFRKTFINAVIHCQKDKHELQKTIPLLNPFLPINPIDA